MTDRFPACLAETLPHEGGWSDHPEDPGGATMRGVTQAVYDGWRDAHGQPRRSVRKITDAELHAIYRHRYWEPIRGADFPAGIDFVTFDASVNSGIGRGPKWTQAALGVAADGKVGPQTIKAAWDADRAAVIRDACARRAGFLRGLRIWSTFGRGWSRRVAAVEAAALRMAIAAHNVSARPELLAEARKARRKVAGEGGKATGAGAAGLTPLPSTDNIPDWAMAGAGVLVAIIVIMFVGRALHERNRAAAFAAAAEKEA